VIGVSQSGEGDDINLVMERAKEAGAFTIAIRMRQPRPWQRSPDETLLIHAGRERSVAATKTYTGQILHFYLLANAIGDKRLNFHQIPELTEKALELEPEVEQAVQRYVFMENCVVVGRGMNYGNSYELALKLMETCYVVAERFSSADFLHGPLAIVERRFPAILFAPAGVTMKSSIELLDRLKSLHADCLTITNNAEIAHGRRKASCFPVETDEILTPIPFAVPAQLFAAHLSEVKGLDPDAPRSLTKVTKTV
jgi:glucosamine--fructose-6-phosphate aminotransferase (isomerizing)